MFVFVFMWCVCVLESETYVYFWFNVVGFLFIQYVFDLQYVSFLVDQTFRVVFVLILNWFTWIESFLKLEVGKSSPYENGLVKIVHCLISFDLGFNLVCLMGFNLVLIWCSSILKKNELVKLKKKVNQIQ